MERLAIETTENAELASRMGSFGSPAVSRALGLGLVSLGLGLAELLMPLGVARMLGLRPSRQTRVLLQALGAREIASGVGLVTRPTSATWIWSRVAGDLIDLALLGEGLFSPQTQHGRLAGAAAAVLGVTAVDAVSAAHTMREAKCGGLEGRMQATESVTINRPPSEVYDFWRDLENLPRFMRHLESVRVTNGKSKWRARGPAGMTIEWDAEVVRDEPQRSIAWRSLRGAMVPNRGTVVFRSAPGGRGTEVLVELSYEPPAGAVGKAFAKLFGEEPSQQISSDLRRLKQVLETGEILNSDASIGRGMHAARPTEDHYPSMKGGQQA